jgi:hypothetical protein
MGEGGSGEMAIACIIGMGPATASVRKIRMSLKPSSLVFFNDPPKS